MRQCDHSIPPRYACRLLDKETGECQRHIDSTATCMSIIQLQTTHEPELTRSAPEFFSQAIDTMKERGKQYDQPNGERSMGKTIAVFNLMTGHNLKESDGWFFMETLKNVRQYQNPEYHEDSAVDKVAYSGLCAEALEAGR